MKTVTIKIKNLPNNVKEENVVLTIQNLIAESYIRAKVELVSEMNKESNKAIAKTINKMMKEYQWWQDGIKAIEEAEKEEYLRRSDC